MTNLDADSANDISMPVADWENLEVDGLALSADIIFNDQMEKVNALRDQQRQYKKSLQMTPQKVLSEAKGTLSKHTDLDGPIRVSIHCFYILRQLLLTGDIDEFPALQSAMAYLAEHGVDAALNAQADLDKLSDTLGVLSDATDRFKSVGVTGTTS